MKSLFLLLALTTFLSARIWKNPSGERSFEAEYVSHNDTEVTLKRPGENPTSYPLSFFHEEDLVFLKAQNATPATNPTEAAFDTLRFGDSRTVVTEKLNASKIVSTTVEKSFFGRTGLNGIFKTNTKIGGLSCALYFEWDGTSLKKIMLRSEPVAKSDYGNRLKACWSELIETLNSMHGKPKQGIPYPSVASLTENSVLSSHLWHTSAGHSVTLGTGQDGDKYSLVVTIVNELIEPVRK